jgi:hypothetical protein
MRWTLHVVPFQLQKQTCVTGITRSKYWPPNGLCTLTSIELNGNCLRSFGDGTGWEKKIPYTFISQVAPSRLCLCLEMFRIIVNVRVCVCVCVCVCVSRSKWSHCTYLLWKNRKVKLKVKANKLLRDTSRNQFFQNKDKISAYINVAARMTYWETVHVSFGVCTAVAVKIIVMRVVTRCNSVAGCRRFVKECCLNL